MATRDFTYATNPRTLATEGVDVLSWSGLLNTDDGNPVELPNYADRSIQVTGTFGAGGTVAIEGSIDGTNYVVLTDPQGNDLNITSSSKRIEAIAEMTRYIRPRVTAGDGTTSLVVWLLARKA